ncbi:MAG TPA: prepilin-type N-terminal cleavage/methylation domain-containing protein, partial [Planctomycetota bacterium]|nr:prepilin-type N-terminal cleavage/methylation domain-containing protein [Planctomycetota bacterium]
MRHAHGAPRGFTLVEVMVAATLGALLLTATASMAGMFGSQLKELDGTQDASLEETLTSLSDEVRYAWWAQVPDSASLTLSDPQGRATRYQFRAGNLLVVRPDGQQGFLLQGLQGGSFSAETVTRYREGSTRVRGGTFWSRTLPVGTTPGATVLEANGKLGIG